MGEVSKSAKAEALPEVEQAVGQVPVVPIEERELGAGWVYDGPCTRKGTERPRLLSSASHHA